MGRKVKLVLPLTEEELIRGEIYTSYIIDSDLFDSKDDGFIKVTEKIEDNESCSTTKQYTINRWGPRFMRKLLSKQYYNFTASEFVRLKRFEMRMNISSDTFELVNINMHKILLKDNEETGWEDIDVVYEPQDNFLGQERKVERALQKKFGIKFEDHTWKSQASNKVIVGVYYQAFADYEEASMLLSEELIQSLFSYTLYVKCKMLLLYDEWKILSLSQIHTLRSKLDFKLGSKIAPSQQTFSEKILNFRQLVKFTNIMELLTQATFDYTKSHISSSPRKLLTETKLSTSPFKKVKPEFYKKGRIYKRGDGPIDWNWNTRIAMLSSYNLSYWEDGESIPRKIVYIGNAVVEKIVDESREYGIIITPKAGSQLYISGISEDDNEEWFHILQEASKYDFEEESENHQHPISKGALFDYKLNPDIASTKHILHNKSMRLGSSNDGIRIFGDNSIEIDIKSSKEEEQKKVNSNEYKSKLIFYSALILGELFSRYVIDLFPFNYIIAILIVAVKFLLSRNKLESQQVKSFKFKAITVFNNEMTSVDACINRIAKFKYWNYYFGIKEFKMPEGFNNSANVRFTGSVFLGHEEIEGTLKIATQLPHEYFFKFAGGSNSPISFNLLITLQRVATMPGKTLVVTALDLTSARHANYEDALTEATHIFSNLSFLNQLLQGIEINPEIIEGGNTITDDPKYDIEAFLYPGFNEMVDVKCRRFISEGRSGLIRGITHQISYDTVDLMVQGAEVPAKYSFEGIKKGYAVCSAGGIECIDPKEIKSQEGLLIELMQRVGKTLLEGTRIVGISLPVRIFEPRSTLERIPDAWIYAPIYFNRAADTSDKLERFKNLVVVSVSGLYNICGQRKPFNPILGETYQGHWQDGTTIDIEHTSHHPPKCNYYVKKIYNEGCSS